MFDDDDDFDEAAMIQQCDEFVALSQLSQLSQASQASERSTAKPQTYARRPRVET